MNIFNISKEVLFEHDGKGKKKFQIGHSRQSKQAQQQQPPQPPQISSPTSSSSLTPTHINVPEGDIDFTAESSLSLVDAGATGAFIQGLEDEFYEVRSSAIDSMCELSVRNNEFAQKNIDFLVDIFTDEIEAVRINSINSLRKIGRIVIIKEEQALLINLQKYPRDLYSIFECLAKIGSKNQFTEFIVEELLRIDPRFAKDTTNASSQLSSSSKSNRIKDSLNY
eukprot:gene13252-15578_t